MPEADYDGAKYPIVAKYSRINGPSGFDKHCEPMFERFRQAIGPAARPQVSYYNGLPARASFVIYLDLRESGGKEHGVAINLSPYRWPTETDVDRCIQRALKVMKEWPNA